MKDRLKHRCASVTTCGNHDSAHTYNRSQARVEILAHDVCAQRIADLPPASRFFAVRRVGGQVL